MLDDESFDEFKKKTSELATQVINSLEGVDSKEAIFALHTAMCHLIFAATPATREQKHYMCTLMINFLLSEREKYANITYTAHDPTMN